MKQTQRLQGWWDEHLSPHLAVTLATGEELDLVVDSGFNGEVILPQPVIRKLRLAAHPRVTQEDLVARLGVRGLQLDRTALLRLESGERRITDIEIIGIAAALKVPVERLFRSS